MLSFRTRIAAAAGAALLATFFALPASAATAAPNSAHSVYHAAVTAQVTPDSDASCNPDPFAAVTECTAVVGEGLEINSIAGAALSNVDYRITDVHIEIYGPHGLIHNCAEFNLGAFATGPTCIWNNPTPKTHVTAGDYCSRAWQKITDNDYIDLSNECIDVHS
jgi:hypothetical protein